MVRVGKHSHAESMYIISRIVDYTNIGWPAAIAMPNIVINIVFSKYFDDSVYRHDYVDTNEDFPGRPYDAESSERCVAELYTGYNKETGIQNKSTAVVPGNKTTKEIAACVVEMDTVVDEYSIEKE
jgi:hypothetical protein